MKAFMVALVIALLTACATPGESSGGLSPGQWSPAKNIGPNKFMVEGFDVEDAVNGAASFCKKSGKEFDVVSIFPHTKTERAIVTFRCL